MRITKSHRTPKGALGSLWVDLCLVQDLTVRTEPLLSLLQGRAYKHLPLRNQGLLQKAFAKNRTASVCSTVCCSKPPSQH